jgi:dihydroorotate dehydrogenase (NAD+) catalytic subunit
VAEIASQVSLPIIGTGGVSTGLDAAEMMMAGATLVGIGSAVWQDGPGVFAGIVRELQTFMDGEGYDRLVEMRGKAIQ